MYNMYIYHCQIRPKTKCHDGLQYKLFDMDKPTNSDFEVIIQTRHQICEEN